MRGVFTDTDRSIPAWTRGQQALTHDDHPAGVDTVTNKLLVREGSNRGVDGRLPSRTPKDGKQVLPSVCVTGTCHG